MTKVRWKKINTVLWVIECKQLGTKNLVSEKVGGGIATAGVLDLMEGGGGFAGKPSFVESLLETLVWMYLSQNPKYTYVRIFNNSLLIHDVSGLFKQTDFQYIVDCFQINNRRGTFYQKYISLVSNVYDSIEFFW